MTAKSFISLSQWPPVVDINKKARLHIVNVNNALLISTMCALLISLSHCVDVNNVNN